MAMKFKPSVYMIILFVLTSLATIAGLYIVVDSMILGEDVKNSLAMLSKAITPAQYYAAVAILSLLIIMKWFGSFIMFRGKPWGVALYLFPNLLLFSVMAYIMSFVSFEAWTLQLWVVGFGTLAFVIAYIVALIMIIKKRKALRKNIAG
ncbi:MAG TPA: hypothetical protein PK855_10025 [Bacteroidales bacterium]|nr:hypothetical protein [Bacteroidales bacterium]